ncbi:hypothetical protein N7494_002600 [Penicillium frequentans]|uniref:SUI1 domain-containing protein n=1 Tax=Penicillium frequentans TaxID=3151616 RepID=A0AAD6D401_9EURO|nr:hypothetical protein N7494_002600 [Penicillium glabrum]
MFKKKPTIIKDYQIAVPSASETSSDAPSTAPSLSAVRNALLPENALTARFTTTAGPDLREVQGIVYVGAHAGGDERVLWFKIEHGPGADKRLYPTVYTLWSNPDLVALLYTPDMVMQKLRAGADLMTPGLANEPPFPERAVKGAVVAVAGLNNHSVPLFVGICEIDVSGLGEVQGTKGVAVRGLHWEGDELWAWSSSSLPGRPAPEYLEGWDEEAGDGVEEAVGDLTLEEAPMGDAVGDTPAAEEPALQEPTTNEIDDAFVKAFVFALYKLKQDNPNAPNHTLTLPVSPSMLIANMITPYLPIYSAQQAQFYNIKKTSWKNVKKFIKHLDKMQLVKSKDRSGQETYIWDVDFDDHRVQRFVPYRLPSKSALESPPSESKKPAATGGRRSLSGTDTQCSNLVPTNPEVNTGHFPRPFHHQPKELLQVLRCVHPLRPIRPITKPPLVSSDNRRIINLNPYLANTIFTSSSSEDLGALKRGMVTRDGLLKRVIEDHAFLQPHYAILKPGQTLADVKPKAGATPKAVITLEKRTGSKTVTKVSNLEVFGIVPTLLAEELQKKCASSTSVTQAVGAPKGSHGSLDSG